MPFNRLSLSVRGQQVLCVVLGLQWQIKQYVPSESKGHSEGFTLGEQHGWVTDLESSLAAKRRTIGGARLEPGRPRGEAGPVIQTRGEED